MKTYGFVFARAGSKGVAKKNVRYIGGKPLVLHALDMGRRVSAIDEMFLSTDCEEASKIAQDNGYTVIDRPAVLATDDAPEWLGWQHAVNWVLKNRGDFERFVSLPPTSPLRIPNDILECIAALSPGTDAVVTMTPASRSPWFNMVKLDSAGFASLLIEGSNFVRRQDSPASFDLTTVAYVLNSQFILENSCMWSGRVRGVVIPRERSIDIDCELDLLIAEFLMSHVMGSST